ncbi:MAG: hypothetical protein JO329_10330 [Planctomycetaceae bacterium]|nr:hypothetical protein [Planctomycetaceae bacterium]
MKTLSRFVTKFTHLIAAVLSCFDRVIFKGHLALAAPRELEYFVDRVLKVRRSDFMKTLAPQYSDRLVQHAQDWAREAGRTYEYRTGQFRKDQWAQDLIRDQGISEGLVGILCTLETCPSFTLVPGPERPQFVSRSRQQRVLYYYFLDPQFGLIHVRLQTWLPFTIQVYVNGHEWLAQQMVQKKLGFVQQHNAFTQLDDPIQAQRLADRFAQLDWPKVLNRWARQVNPLLSELFPGYPVHWVVDQAEYATDLLFQSRTALSGLYRALLDYAVRTFTPKDILGFLGRKWDRRFDGEVHTQYEDERWFGTRIKHRMKTNWLKMYDKFSTILRIETVINSAKEFWVYRTQYHRDGTSSAGYYPMTKSVSSLVDYQEQALACNRRYLDALAVVNDPPPAYPELRQLTEPKVVDGRSYAGFNPARRDDVRLFRAVLDGDHIARGFRNGDIRQPLFGRLKTMGQQRRASAAVGRLLKRLHVRHLVAKIPRTRRWRVTERGRHLLGVAIQLYRCTWPELAA